MLKSLVSRGCQCRRKTDLTKDEVTKVERKKY